MAVLTMGPLIALSTLSATSSYSALAKTSRTRLVDASRLTAAYVQTRMTALATFEDAEAHTATLVGALGDGNHASYDRTAIVAVLKDFRSVQQGIHLASIVEPSGVYFGPSDPPTPPALNGQTFGYRDWYQGVVRSGRPYVSSAYASAVPGAPLLVATAGPIRADGRYAPEGRVVAYLVVAYDLTTMQRLFANFARSEGVKLQLTDQKGNVVASSGVAPTTLVQDASPGVAGALKGAATVTRTRVAATDSFASYSPVPGIGWTVRASIPASVALADANHLLSYILIIAGVLAAALVLVKFLLYLALSEVHASARALASANSGLELQVAARTAELEASVRDAEAFTYSVSHDLRSPLRAVSGFSQIVLDNNRNRLSPESVAQLGRVVAGTVRMGALIDDLLAFSRLGRAPLTKQRVNPTAMVNDVLDELREANHDRDIEFVVGDLPPCEADPALLAQVWQNLLANAVKFTATRPTAHIEIGTINEGNPQMVTYFVTDNGVGFDMQYAGKLFGVFQRLHASDEFPGTGIGLALVKRIIDRHGGGVWAEGTLDAGASIYFTVPRPATARPSRPIPGDRTSLPIA